MVEPVTARPSTPPLMPAGRESLPRALAGSEQAPTRKSEPESPTAPEPVPVESPLRNVSISFTPRPDLDLIQSHIVDRETSSILQDIPSKARIRFAERFRDTAAKWIESRFDLRA